MSKFNLTNHNIMTLKSGVTVILVTIIYLIIIAVFIGLKVEHWVLAIFFILMYFSHATTRKLILAFSIFIIFGIIYDLMRVYPNYLVNNVDISSIYHFDKRWFGLFYNNQHYTLNEFFAIHHSPIFDFLTGLCYLNWISVPIGFAIYLYVNNKRLFLNFSITFLLVNLMGFCIYYIHPAAPPWYVAQYGFDLKRHIPGSTAGLYRFDRIIHIPVFASIYTQNSNVFASIPSLHSAYPVVVLYYAIKAGLEHAKWFLGIFMFGIWFTAIYSGHHYVTDVLLGILCALTGIGLYQRYLLNTAWYSKTLDQYLHKIQ